MNMMKKIQKFFSLDYKATNGFTLVELIVVIAILAILAGVAIPVYNGYITKANEAADNQLLSAVNTAFAAACLEKGVDMTSYNAGQLKVNLTGEAGHRKVASVVPAEYDEAFKRYFEGNEASEFKVFFDLEFNGEVFVNAGSEGSGSAGGAEGQITISYNGNTFTVNVADLEAVLGSSYMDIGVDTLLNQVDNVTDLVDTLSGFNKTFMNNVLNSDEFKESAAKALGVSVEKLGEKCKALAEEMAEAAGEDPTDPAVLDKYVSKVEANAAVLYAAQTATQMTSDEISNITDLLLQGGSVAKNAIKDNLKGEDTETGFAQATVVYGLYLAYANSEFVDEDERTDILEIANDPTRVMDNLNDPNFRAYLSSADSTYEQDLEGYLAALNIASGVTGNSGAVEDLIINGFNDGDLVELIEKELGNLKTAG